MIVHPQSARNRPPKTIRPLLWSLRWENLDIQKDKEDIIVNIVNEGSLDQWRWLLRTYGKKSIRQVLARRLESEFHPESRHLAQVMFAAHFRHAR